MEPAKILNAAPRLRSSDLAQLSDESLAATLNLDPESVIRARETFNSIAAAPGGARMLMAVSELSDIPETGLSLTVDAGPLRQMGELAGIDGIGPVRLTNMITTLAGMDWDALIAFQDGEPSGRLPGGNDDDDDGYGTESGHDDFDEDDKKFPATPEDPFGFTIAPPPEELVGCFTITPPLVRVRSPVLGVLRGPESLAKLAGSILVTIGRIFSLASTQRIAAETLVRLMMGQMPNLPQEFKAFADLTFQGLGLADRVLRERLNKLLPDGIPPLQVESGDLTDFLERTLTDLLNDLKRIVDAAKEVDFAATEPRVPQQIVGIKGGFVVSGPVGQEFSLRIVSRMSSTYSYGVGQGIRPVNPRNDAAPPVADRPWFAKLRVQGKLAAPDLGMNEELSYTLQLGASGKLADTQFLFGKLQKPKATIAVKVNGNYGQAAVFLRSLEKNDQGRLCPEQRVLFKVLGKFEEDILKEAQAEFDQNDKSIRDFENIITLAIDVLDFLSTVPNVLPVLGDAGGATISGIKNALKTVSDSQANLMKEMNDRLLEKNRLAADPYPERSPVGDAEKTADAVTASSMLKKVPMEVK